MCRQVDKTMMSKRAVMKVLIVNTSREKSSTGKIAYGLYEKIISQGDDALFAYGIGRKEKGNKSLVKVTTRCEYECNKVVNLLTGYHGGFSPVSTYKLCKIIRIYKPDVVQLYNLHGYYINISVLLNFLKKNHIPTVYSMLDEYPYLGYCCYSYECDGFKTGCRHCANKWDTDYMRSLWLNRAKKTLEQKKKAYEGFEKVVFVGPKWVVQRAKESFLLKDKVLREVDEYIDTEKIFRIRETDKLREKLGIAQDKIIILNVAPASDKRKGIDFFVNVAQRMEGTKFIFINVGYSDMGRELPTNFIGIPFLTDQVELAEFYSLADLLMCSSIADTMPNVCLDALACGTPVCGFKVTGIPYVAKEPMGRFVDKNDMDGMIKIIEKTEKKSVAMKQMCREYAQSRYSLETYYSKMMEIYHELIER